MMAISCLDLRIFQFCLKTGPKKEPVLIESMEFWPKQVEEVELNISKKRMFFIN